MDRENREIRRLIRLKTANNPNLEVVVGNFTYQKRIPGTNKYKNYTSRIFYKGGERIVRQGGSGAHEIRPTTVLDVVHQREVTQIQIVRDANGHPIDVIIGPPPQPPVIQQPLAIAV